MWYLSMEKMEVMTQASLSTLPTEMLDAIFSLLEARDIRSIRRVNKRLNELSNRSVYCDNEIFCWKKVNNTRRIIKLLNGSRRSVFNLLIDAVDFEDDFVMTFFKKHGSKVHFLSFRDCHFPGRLLQNIIQKCSALRSFSFTISRHFDSIVEFGDFRKFEADSIVLEEVTSLTFVSYQTPQKWLDEPTFRRFISIFPNVTQFDIQITPIPYRLNSDSEASDSKSSTLLTDSSIYNCILQMGKNLESLTTSLYFLTVSKIGECFFEALPNLKHLCLNRHFSQMGELDLFFDQHYSLTDEIEIQKWRTQLQRIPSLEIRNYNRSATNLLRTLKLKHLTTTMCNMVMSSDLFLELLRSEVQTASFAYMEGWANPRSVVDSHDLRKNTTLTDLHLENYCEISSKTVALFPVYFSALVHLKLDTVSNAILQNIFENQKNLRSLHLGDCLSCNLYGFTGTIKGDQLSIRELQNLEHLTIVCFRGSIANSKRFKEAFHLPRLKYLNLTAFSNGTVNSVNKLPVAVFESMKNLEALRLTGFGEASFEELTSLCQNLKNLRYFYCNDNRTLDNEVCIVDLSKSTFEDLRLKNDRCYYDEKLKKIVLNPVFNCILFSPKISSFVINWIVF